MIQHHAMPTQLPLTSIPTRLKMCTQVNTYGNTQGWHSPVSRKTCHLLVADDKPVAITRHGDTVGYYLPARRKRSETERAALKEAAAQLQEMLAAEDTTEDEVIADFRRWRAGRRK